MTIWLVGISYKKWPKILPPYRRMTPIHIIFRWMFSPCTKSLLAVASGSCMCWCIWLLALMLSWDHCSEQFICWCIYSKAIASDTGHRQMLSTIIHCRLPWLSINTPKSIGGKGYRWIVGQIYWWRERLLSIMTATAIDGWLTKIFWSRQWLSVDISQNLLRGTMFIDGQEL